MAEENVSARLAPRDGSHPGSKELSSKAIVLPSDLTLELRKFAIQKALAAVDTLNVLEVEDAAEFGNIIIDTADKIEKYILEGKKEEAK